MKEDFSSVCCNADRSHRSQRKHRGLSNSEVFSDLALGRKRVLINIVENLRFLLRTKADPRTFRCTFHDSEDERNFNTDKNELHYMYRTSTDLASRSHAYNNRTRATHVGVHQAARTPRSTTPPHTASYHISAIMIKKSKIKGARYSRC